ncbi:MAG: Uma2 family endonuclease [Deltaproteobacteria bacterium]|nr:Uma2 family endonuclease [Deltaproteobacteria bacterium]
MTDAEWCAMDEDEEGELVDGILVEEEMPTWMHGAVVGWLLRALGSWLIPLGGTLAPDVKFLLRPGRGRKPDIAMVVPPSPMPPRTGALRRPVDVLIEVVSAAPSDHRRDRLEKADEYAVFGVPWYWLVDPEARMFEIWHLEHGRYVRDLGAIGGRIAKVPGCPGLSLDLDSLWAEIDRLGPPDPAEGERPVRRAPIRKRARPRRRS